MIWLLFVVVIIIVHQCSMLSLAFMSSPLGDMANHQDIIFGNIAICHIDACQILGQCGCILEMVAFFTFSHFCKLYELYQR